MTTTVTNAHNHPYAHLQHAQVRSMYLKSCFTVLTLSDSCRCSQQQLAPPSALTVTRATTNETSMPLMSTIPISTTSATAMTASAVLGSNTDCLLQLHTPNAPTPAVNSPVHTQAPVLSSQNGCSLSGMYCNCTHIKQGVQGFSFFSFFSFFFPIKDSSGNNPARREL